MLMKMWKETATYRVTIKFYSVCLVLYESEEKANIRYCLC